MFWSSIALDVICARHYGRINYTYLPFLIVTGCIARPFYGNVCAVFDFKNEKAIKQKNTVEVHTSTVFAFVNLGDGWNQTKALPRFTHAASASASGASLQIT